MHGRMRAFLALLCALFTTLLAGCGTGAGNGLSAVGAAGGVAPPASRTRAAHVSSRTDRVLGEVGFVRDASLRANLLHDTVVYTMESSSEPPHGDDSDGRGTDVVPFRLKAPGTFVLHLNAAVVREVTVRDTNATVVARLTPPTSTVLNLAAGDYTLTIEGVGDRTAAVFLRPLAHGALPSVTLTETAPAIQGVPTAVTAFVGDLATGPVNQPTPVVSWAEFTQRFGSIDPARPLPAQVYQFFAQGGQSAIIVRVPPAPAGGALPASAFNDAFTSLASVPFNLLVLPDLARPVEPPPTDVAVAAIAFAEARDAFVILDFPAAVSQPHDALAWFGTQVALRSSRAAIYFGRLNVTLPNQTTASLGPCGTVAGLHASTDASEGVWAPPVGVVNAVSVAPSLYLTEAQPLLDAGINVIFNQQGGPTVAGARTTDNTPGSLGRIAAQRLKTYIEQSLNEGLLWVVFAPNDGQTWANAAATVSTFMTSLWSQGALFGATPSQAFTVLCGLGTTMTAQDLLYGFFRLSVTYRTDPEPEFIELWVQLESAQS